MTDHHLIDHERLERWLEDHENAWLTPLLLLTFLIFAVVLFELFADNDAFLLNNTISVVSNEW